MSLPTTIPEFWDSPFLNSFYCPNSKLYRHIQSGLTVWLNMDSAKMRTIWRWTKMSSVRMELLCHKFSMTISSQSKWQRKFAPYRKVIWHSCYFSYIFTGFAFLFRRILRNKITRFAFLSLLSLCRKHRFQLQGKLAPLNHPQFDDGFHWTIQNWSVRNSDGSKFSRPIQSIKIGQRKSVISEQS